jgi:hypothetical protein
MIRRLAIALVALSLTAAAANAATGFESVAASFQPRVPVSLLGSLGGLTNRFDPSRFHMTTTVSMGTGSGFGASGLSVTSFSYKFRAPLAMSVRVGNAFGAGTSSSSSMFLEGMDISYQPSANSVFRVQFQNVRSPLQYGYGNGNPERSFWDR